MRRRPVTPLLIALCVCVALAPSRVDAAIVPPHNPPHNLPPTRAFLGACEDVSNSSVTCINAAIAQLALDRSKESVGPMTLPLNFRTLPAIEQVFVVTNLERVDRGLAPMAGLSSYLDKFAQRGANEAIDPPFPTGRPFAAGANWSGGSNLFVADQLWMYDDGRGGENLDCTATVTTGCWGHRDNILGAWTSPALMGAGWTTIGPWGGSVTQLFLGGDTKDTAFFKWTMVTPHLPIGVSAAALSLVVAPPHTVTVKLHLWASGEKMNTTLRLSRGAPFTLSRSACALRAGQTCTILVTFRPTSARVTRATLFVTGPNGTRTVALTGTS